MMQYQNMLMLQSRLSLMTLNKSLTQKSSQLTSQLRRRFSSAPQQNKTFQFKENPIIFNKINETMVIKGKEKMVGIWLLTLSASVFSIVLLGGYTRLTRSGLSMVKWHPHRVGLPSNQEEWEKEFEEYKEFPEYYLVNKQRGMDLEGFKRIYFVEWAHRIVARSIGVIFILPFSYFLLRGHLQPKLKKALFGLLGFGALQGFFGWWMVKSGLVDKNKTKELDKTPSVSPYRLTVHGYSAYLIYGVGIWLALNCLRRPQEAVINISNMADHASMRKILLKSAHGLLPVILLFGFFTSGTMARYAVNNFPFVGDKRTWLNCIIILIYDYNPDIPLWQNFTENKIFVQVIHRTLATIFAILAFKGGYEVYQLKNLTPIAKRSYMLLLAAITLQVCIGISAIWYPSEIWIPNIHQAGALTVLTALIFACHTCRKVDPRHIRNLLGKLKVEDPKAYEVMMKGFNQKKLSKTEMEAMQKYYKGE